jgi:hypothetical protein
MQKKDLHEFSILVWASNRMVVKNREKKYVFIEMSFSFKLLADISDSVKLLMEWTESEMEHCGPWSG